MSTQEDLDTMVEALRPSLRARGIHAARYEAFFAGRGCAWSFSQGEREVFLYAGRRSGALGWFYGTAAAPRGELEVPGTAKLGSVRWNEPVPPAETLRDGVAVVESALVASWGAMSGGG